MEKKKFPPALEQRLNLRVQRRSRSEEPTSTDIIQSDKMAVKIKPVLKKHLKDRDEKRTKRSKFLFAGIFLCTAILFVRHPKTASFAAEFLSPAERILSEMDRWGNFTVTSSIRSAINDVFNVSANRVEPELPFYIDIISGSNTTMRRPVVFLPGYITSGLEIWSNLPCAKARFRERIWGTANMVKLFITDSHCWVQHMLMTPIYGQEIDGVKSVHFADPVGIKIKPTSGLASADFVLGDYWVWNPIIEALGYAGYDENLMWMMSYDWRVPARDLEFRDKFFTRMMLEIEKLVKLNGEQVFLVTHSYGGKVWFFFINWLSHHYSPDWIDEHIFGSYHISPVMLGVPKALAALLSGDTRDTAQLGALSTLVDTLLPPSDRAALTASWGSIVDMLPEGGEGVWPESVLYLNGNLSNPINMTGGMELLFNTTSMAPHAHHYLLNPSIYRCPSDSAPARSCYKDDWARPLSTPLPAFQKSRIWCTYGVGIPTEVGYHYSTSGSDLRDNGIFRIDTSMLSNGIILDDGDGSVPTQSLGFVCAHTWRKGSSFNPTNITVEVRELPHGESYSVLSRANSVGGSSVDHVDIMGNRFVVRDILRIALGLQDALDPPTKDLKVLQMNLTYS